MHSGINVLVTVTMTKLDHSILSEIDNLCDAYTEYCRARSKLLSLLPRSISGRDPTSEFSEALVAKILNAKSAASPVQKGYDLIRSDNRTVQVRSLSNSKGAWKNFHTIDFNGDCDEYALVVFVDRQLKAVLVFTRDCVENACRLLSKRHANQKTTLQIYESDFRAFLRRQNEFETIGMSIYTFISGH